MTKKSLLGKLKIVRLFYIAGLCLLVMDFARDFIYGSESPFADFTMEDAGALSIIMCICYLLEVVYLVCKHYIEKNVDECCGLGECKCKKSQG